MLRKIVNSKLIFTAYFESIPLLSDQIHKPRSTGNPHQ